MRKLLILSTLTLLTASAVGCTSRNPCGESWRPGYYLFGAGRNNYTGYNNYQPAGGDCCEPCATSPLTVQGPCCQQ
jgi:hypothetical protein